MNRHRIPSDIATLAGLWLIISPFVLGHAFYRPALWSEVILGVLIAALAAGRAFGHTGAWAAWANVILAGWLLITPTVFNYDAHGVPATNDVIVALIVAVCSILSTFALPHNEDRSRMRVVHFSSAEPTDEDRR